MDALNGKVGPGANGPVSPVGESIGSLMGLTTGALTPAAEAMPPKEVAALDEAKDRKPEERKPDRKNKAKEMTEEDYLGLNDLARAGVDFNTMLVLARREDRAQRRAGGGQDLVEKQMLGQTGVATSVPMPGGMPRVQQAGSTRLISEELPDGYGDMFEKVFGSAPTRLRTVDGQQLDPDAKMPKVSPDVLSVLNQVGYESNNPDDMRDFLKLDKGISLKDIDKFLNDDDNDIVGQDPSPQRRHGGPAKSSRELLVEDLARKTMGLQEALEKGDQMIADFAYSARAAREPERTFLGAEPRPVVKLPTENLTKQGEKMFEETLQYLLQQPDRATAQAELSSFGAYLQQQGGDPQAFIDYAAAKLSNADSGIPLGNEPGVKYRSPDEYRQLLGLTKEG